MPWESHLRTGNTKRTIKELKKSKPDTLIKIGELAILVDVKQSTLKYYSEEGMLPYIQRENGSNRLYPRKQAVLFINYIKSYKEKRLTVEEMKEKLSKKLEKINIK